MYLVFSPREARTRERERARQKESGIRYPGSLCACMHLYGAGVRACARTREKRAGVLGSHHEQKEALTVFAPKRLGRGGGGRTGERRRMGDVVGREGAEPAEL